MDVLATILGIVLMIVGVIMMFKDGREKGIGYVVLEIVGGIILAALGL